MTDHTTDTQAAINAGLALAKVLDINGTPAVLLPQGAQMAIQHDMRDHPQRIHQAVALHDAESFIDYYNRFALDASTIYCDLRKGTFRAIIDYHDGEAGNESVPGWCQHTAAYTCPKTPEWVAWLACNNQKMDQVGFGRFIEDRVPEIVTPDGATMLEIALSLRARTKVNFERATRLDNGQTQLTWHEDIEGRAGAKGQLDIPETIELGMQLFDGGHAYSLQARFRYRINEGQLAMWYELIRPEKAHETAIRDIVEMIKKGMARGQFLFGETGR